MNAFHIGLIVTLVLGVILFFFLASRRKYRDASAAQNYEKIRNKLSTRELKVPKKKEQEREYTGGFLSNIIGAIIVLFIGLSLMPTVAEVVNQAMIANTSANVTIASTTMLQIVPFFFGLALAVTTIALLYTGLRNVGIV